MQYTIEVKGVDRALDEVKDYIDRFTNGLVDEFRSQVIPRTPIDTGRARRGWQVRKGITKRIENNVPYIGALERGRSRQAPRGFVKQSISAAIAETERTTK